MKIGRGEPELLTPQEFLARWNNRYDLAMYDPVAVRNLAIPENAKEFLILAGLPMKSTFDESYNPLPTLEEAFGSEYPFAPDCKSMRVLGILQKHDKIRRFWCLN